MVTTTTITKTQPPWPELLGAKKWKGLLDPVDLSLLNLILFSGDLCQVTYDSFNSDEHSPYCGSCRYNKRHLLDKVCFPSAANYSVAEFLYATSEIDLPGDFLLFSLSREAWSKESNWIGYIAVSTDAHAATTGRREIYVAWRGTIRSLEWIDVLTPKLVPLEPLLSTPVADGEEPPKVMDGWYTIYTSSDPKSPFTKESARTQLLTKIKQLVQLYKDESLSIVCAGHSLGAALAILSAFDIVQNGLSKTAAGDDFPVSAVVFGSPQIGNKEFNEQVDKFPNLEVLHIKNGIDLIPLYPSGLLGYAYTGTELVIDTKKSPYLKDSKNPSDWHNLQAILHTAAGWNGKDGEFSLRVKRSVALVNKSCEYLKDEILVPGSWWVEKNKGMVLSDNGEWLLAPPAGEDIPEPPLVYGTDLNQSIPEVNPVSSNKKGAAKKKSGSVSTIKSFVSCFRGQTQAS